MIAPRRNDPQYLDDAALFDDLKRTLLHNPQETAWVATYKTPIAGGLEDMLQHIAKAANEGKQAGAYNTPGLRRIHELFHVCKDRDTKDEIKIYQLQGELTNLNRQQMRLPAFAAVVKAAYEFLFTRYSGKSPLRQDLDDSDDAFDLPATV